MGLEMSPLVRAIDKFYNGIAILAGFAILVAIGLTFADVLLRTLGRLAVFDSGLRRSWGVPGLIDLTQLAILTAASLSIAFGFWRGSHVFVDILVERFSPVVQRFVRALSALLASGLMLGCFWFGVAEMQRQLDFHTTSATLGIPFTWFWLPLLTGLLLATFAVLAGPIAPLLGNWHKASGTVRIDREGLSIDMKPGSSMYD